MLDYITRLLFEDRPLLLVTEAIALAVVLAIHRHLFTPRTRRAVWITLGLCALLLVVQALIVTRRETLQQMVSELAQAVDEGDVAAIAERVDDDFRWQIGGEVRDRPAFVREVNERLQRWQVDEAKVWGFQIQIDGDDAVVSFSAVCDWRSGEHVENNLPSFWTLQCVHHPDGWKLTRIAKAKVGPGGRYDLSEGWNY